MPYAMSVIVSRAIPEIDGFKPSHRKPLYTMYKMGSPPAGAPSPPTSWARPCASTPTAIRPSTRPWCVWPRETSRCRTPLWTARGNFGKVYSRDMAYAASRYTEAKLAPHLCRAVPGSDCDAVDFVDNYDNTTKEPTLLPTTYPNVLVSANQGIAVGMASQICGFNLAGGVRYHHRPAEKSRPRHRLHPAGAGFSHRRAAGV